MRGLLAALIATAATGALATLASAPVAAQDQVLDQPILPDETIAAVTLLAAKGYATPEAAEVRNVHLSKARNGRGYCGEVSVEGSAGEFTTFHVILAEGNEVGSSLRASDYPMNASSTQDDTVQLLLHNFGCTE